MDAAPATATIADGFWGAVGRTPLIRLRRASAATGCEILGKAEFMNPGGSVKDRAALGILKHAVARGLLVPGQPGTVVEGTAGNTGIGIALAANAMGWRSIIVVPETQSREKLDYLRMIGADLRLVPPKPFAIPATTCMSRAGSRRRWAPSGPTSSTTWPMPARMRKRPAPRSGTRPPA
jgi:cysteine synthase A